MKQPIAFLLMTSLLTTIIVGCDKEDTIPPSPHESLLTLREWKIVDITRKSLTNPEKDSSLLKTSNGDDRVKFFTNRQFDISDGTLKSDSTLLYDKGSWSYVSTQNVIQLAGTKRAQKWQVQLLNDTLLKVQWLDSVSATNKVLKTIQLKNK